MKIDSNRILNFAFSFKIWPIVVQITNMQLKNHCQSSAVSKSSAFQAEDHEFQSHPGKKLFSFYLWSTPILGAKFFFSCVIVIVILIMPYVEKSVFYLSVWFIPCYTPR